MTPDAFIRKWRDATLKERSAAQEHFIDLCRLLDEPTPAEADPTGQWFTFEYGATKAGGGNGWADIWRRARFGWEYKGKGKDLQAAFKQLQLYAPALEYPPLLIVCDIDSIVIHTAFTGTVPTVRVITLDDLRDPKARQVLKWAFTDPERLRPGQTTAALTESAAGRFGDLALTLRGRGHDAWSVGHFCIRLLFCLFAEDIGLLPQRLFTRLLDAGQDDPADLETMLGELFGAMATGGRIGFETVDWFNGGLFDSRETLPLDRADIQTLRELARLDWSAIEPSIFGTLFERGLDPDKRSQLGAHYTDRDAIMRIVDPVVLDPLRAEWAARKERIETALARLETTRSPATRTRIKREAQTLLVDFLARLERFRALDPACGSGNFLLLALLGLKDLEHQVILEAEALGLPPVYPVVGPENVLGIEINPYAAELARVTVWIGEIQWMRNHGFSLTRNPILRTLDTIQQRDALLAAPPAPGVLPGHGPAESGDDGKPAIAAPGASEADWPAADVIIGNPPFLGGSKKRGQLGDAYFQALNAVYADRVPGGADLVCYWFEKARAQIAAGRCQAAGLVATNSIRGGANRKVLERIVFGTLSSGQPGDTHGDGNLRYPETGGKTEIGGLRAGTGRSGSARHRGRAGRDGDESLSGRRAGESVGADPHRSGGAEMDDGHPAGRGDLAGDEELLLTPAHEPALTKAEVSGAERLRIFNAWSDEPWVNDGAAVRVSLICFGRLAPSPPGGEGRGEGANLAPPSHSPLTPNLSPHAGEGSSATLNGQPVAAILADLTGQPLEGDGEAVDLTRAVRLAENLGTCFMGASKKAPFDIPGELARSWLNLPNPHQRGNAEVLRPLWNGLDLTRRPRDIWIIDFGTDMSDAEAALFERPFEYVVEHVKPEREKNNREAYRKYWWRHAEPRPGMRAALLPVSRYIVTPHVSKHRLFVWLDSAVLSDQMLLVTARADDTTFGILHSRFHELWSLRMGTSLEDRPRYTPTTTFETFPFPAGLTPADTVGATLLRQAQHESGRRTEPQASGLAPGFAEGARLLHAGIAQGAGLQQATPILPDLADPSRLPAAEAIAQAGFPPRPVAKLGHEADLKKRTLTNLYNARPAWLAMAHEKLDRAVAAAYGWDDYTPDTADDDILRRLLALNRARRQPASP